MNNLNIIELFRCIVQVLGHDAKAVSYFSVATFEGQFFFVKNIFLSVENFIKFPDKELLSIP